MSYREVELARPHRNPSLAAPHTSGAEFFAARRGWVPIDASEAAKAPEKREYFFGAHDENRIEFSRGRDLVLVPPQQGEPLNFFIYPYAELNGQPFTGLETKITFRDIR